MIGRRRAAVDLSGVTFMDTSGLHAIVSGAGSRDGPSAALLLIDPPPRIVQLMELVGVVRMSSIEIRSRDGG
jgi:anti-anti-sigma regulatory factor